MKKIPLFLAILININIVIGGGFFLTVGDISQKAGALAPLSWILVGLALLPVVMCFALLSKHFPVAGGLYVYPSETLGEFWGFLSGWAYFIGTAAGNAIILHGFSALSTELGLTSFLKTSLGLSVLGIDIFLVCLFSILTLCDIQFLEALQKLFTTLKAIPFVLVGIGSLFLLKSSNFVVTDVSTSAASIISAIPLALFAYIGIEACTSIGHVIEDGEKNTSRAILISFALIISVYAITQLLLVGIHGANTVRPFADILPMLTSNKHIIYFGNMLVQGAILSSFLGGFYSMFYANNWNLQTIASNDSIHGSAILKKINRHNSPWAAVLAQAALIIFLLCLTQNLDLIVTMSDFGIIIAYILATASLFSLYKNGALSKKIIAILGFAGCWYLLKYIVSGLLKSGPHYILPFLAILLAGIISYAIKKRQIL